MLLYMYTGTEQLIKWLVDGRDRFLTAGAGGYKEARGKGWDDPCSNRVELGISVRTHVHLAVDTDITILYVIFLYVI